MSKVDTSTAYMRQVVDEYNIRRAEMWALYEQYNAGIDDGLPAAEIERRRIEYEKASAVEDAIRHLMCKLT